ncbi:MAG: M23 family metallopeptidase [Clostridia bacterium]|nr:M23 family metallopeptidase [Clostridia bacterium]
MDSKKKKSLVTTGTYIVLSFSFIVLLGVGMFSVLRNSMPDEQENVSPKTVIDNVEPLPQKIIPSLPDQQQNNEVFESELIPENDTTSVEEKIVEPINEVTVYVMPIDGEITKDFSNETLVFSQTMKDYRTHKGIDIKCESGQIVKSFANGTIESFSYDQLNGMTMTVKHDKGIVTRYCNLSQELPEGIEVGCRVNAGDSIAYVGESGILECAEDSHLHFEIIENGTAVGLSNFELAE